MSSKQNILIEQGATFSLDVALTDSHGDTLDVTGYTAKAQLKKDPDAATAYDLVTTLTSGSLNLSMTAANTALLDYGRYMYDVILINGSIITRLVEGLATVTPRITVP